MPAKKLKKISVAMSVQGEGTWITIPITELAIEIDDTGSYNELVRNVNNAMVAVRTHLDTMQRFSGDEIVCKWKEYSSAAEAKKEEEARHKDGGDVWTAINRATTLESENACLKKQVQDLIGQLSRNIEQEREDGTL